MSRSPIVVLAWVLVLLGLAACGTTEPASGGARSPSAPTGGEIALTDARGRQVTLPRPATRVVTLEWNATEHVVSLGVMPVGAADVAGYGNWVKAAPLDPSVRDVGVRGEPSVDAIAALRPDLVVATDELPEGAVAQMEAFAPVLFLPGGAVADPIGQMKRNIEQVGRALGKDAEAAAQVQQFDARLAEGRDQLAGRAGQRFVFADGYVEGGQVSIRPFTDGSLIGAVTTGLGLTNAWTEPGDATYGLAQTDVEGLTRVGDATFLYIVNDADGGDPFRNELSSNAVWQSLPWVRTNQVDRLPDGIWVFGGPVSMQRYIDATVDALNRA
ncbi:iron-siderophore ABC transporter substrate-binding protein [Actinomycetospora straminea]|uniref:Siderophore ABC transporter substrate-binding protein CdtB n=1 Tax=Actinomycetospora straminea TaxID=663607 RepID=A0ABP9EE98_9PSEU|nr:iron-siderophore ABC transporter substrate-binding protein [Actinomycetospora straminea]MDD7931937.1 iron-siderophore ABC transporter substrate-binding protein [Actinomycetospora straminea]